MNFFAQNLREVSANLVKNFDTVFLFSQKTQTSSNKRDSLRASLIGNPEQA